MEDTRENQPNFCSVLSTTKPTRVTGRRTRDPSGGRREPFAEAVQAYERLNNSSVSTKMQSSSLGVTRGKLRWAMSKFV